MSELARGELISCDGWHDSYPERNTFIPRRRDMMTRGDRGKLLLGAKGCGQDNAITPEEEEWL